MTNVRVVASRAEDSEGDYEWLVSRAVDPGALMKLKLARGFAILLGADDASKLQADEVIPLLWGDRRVLAIGTFHVKQSGGNH